MDIYQRMYFKQLKSKYPAIKSSLQAQDYLKTVSRSSIEYNNILCLWSYYDYNSV